VYWALNRLPSVIYRNIFTLISSYFFYGWWDYRFLILIFFSSLVDYILGIQIGKSQNRRKKIFLIASISINLGILAFFKYFNFFIDSTHDLLALLNIPINTRTLNIILPVGISFYTFQSLSYTIDIYKQKIQATKNILTFFTFVSFFPQLVAGPIERASHLLNQFNDRKIFSYSRTIQGLRLVLWGLFKKVVIADNVGLLTDHIFNPQNPLTALVTFIGALSFAFQIYCDFSGYSDIAIGIAKMLGFDLMQNFRTPYFATSLSDFWHRWHISLSTWFRDYVYIPLGGSREKPMRAHFNIFITFVLSGFWHGAQFTFMIWGALHGLFLLIEKHIPLRVKNWISIPFVFIITTVLWLPFRANNFGHLMQMIKSFSVVGYSHEILSTTFLTVYSTAKLSVLIAVFILFLITEFKIGLLDFNLWIGDKPKVWRMAFYYLLLISILMLGNFDVKPNFIYFQF